MKELKVAAAGFGAGADAGGLSPPEASSADMVYVCMKAAYGCCPLFLTLVGIVQDGTWSRRGNTDQVLARH